VPLPPTVPPALPCALQDPHGVLAHKLLRKVLERDWRVCAKGMHVLHRLLCEADAPAAVAAAAGSADANPAPQGGTGAAEADVAGTLAANDSTGGVSADPSDGGGGGGSRDDGPSAGAKRCAAELVRLLSLREAGVGGASGGGSGALMAHITACGGAQASWLKVR
jgi:hypothetical protein